MKKVPLLLQILDYYRLIFWNKIANKWFEGIQIKCYEQFLILENIITLTDILAFSPPGMAQNGYI